MKKATLLLNTRDDYPNGVVVAKSLYRLAQPTVDAPHGYSYRLHCGTTAGETLVRFDNETGKGDHVHLGVAEEPYCFTTPDRLLADFEAAIKPYATGD